MPKHKYVVDRASGRLVVAGPEEINATQPLVEALVEEAGWDIRQLVTRPQWRVPSSPSNKRVWPVDVAIFDDSEHAGDPEHVVALCECKRPDVETGIEQLKIYLDREPHARLGVWFNGTDHAVVYKTPQGYAVAVAGTPLPAAGDPLVPPEHKPLTVAALRTAPSLVPVFRRIRDRLAAQDQNVNRDEEILPDISLLLLLKILDEQASRFTPDKPLAFQIDDTAKKTGVRMRKYLDDQVSRHPELFGTNSARFSIDDESIYYVVQTLQNYRLLANEADAISQAFQTIRGKAYKGEEGQYFTPPSVVAVAIAAVDPRPEDRVVDPACGSGTFLAGALDNVVDRLRVTYKDEAALTLAKRDWASQNLYAVDKDSVSVRLSKAYLSMLGDGSTHVYKADSLRPSSWTTRTDNLAAVVKYGGFDVVVTNPPFGTKLKIPVDQSRAERYELAKEWVREGDGWVPTDQFVERELGLIFLEHSIRLLNDGGRMAIVIPDTYLFSESYGWLVHWLTSRFTITHSINVPIEAFEPHCRAKTTIVVLQKTPPTEDVRIVGSLCSTFGEDKHGRQRFKFDKGAMTDVIDDEMNEAAVLLRKPPQEDQRLHFTFSQREAAQAGVLVASYWWRKPYLEALRTFADENDCDLVAVGDLLDAGELTVLPGHGSPSSHYHGKGNTPYIKVIDIKNWRINENPKYAIPDMVAEGMYRGRPLEAFDLVMPTRASKNIGLFSLVLPWQTNVVLTREIAIWRVSDQAKRVSPFLLLALASLRVVHEQFTYLVLMQTNREDLGARYKELLLPIPRTNELRAAWETPVRDYFEAQVEARRSYVRLTETLSSDLFVDRP